jgi:hypothetical protein
MKLYFEYVILENLIFYFLILIQVFSFLKQDIRKIRLICALVIYTSLALIKIKLFNNFLIELIETLTLIYICFNSKSIKSYFRQVTTYLYIYILNISVTIFIVIFSNINIDSILNKILVYLISFFVCILINKFVWKLLINNIKNNNLIYTLILNKKKYKMFLDTGNNLFHTEGEVLIMNTKKYIKNNYKKVVSNNAINNIDIDIKTINSKEKEKGIIFNDVVIKKNKEEYKLEKAIVVFVDNDFNNQYDGIISYNTYVEKLGGIN